MSEAVKKIEICSKCGADIREKSLFCYGCGTDLSVTDVVKDADPGSIDSVSLEQEMPSQQEMEKMFDPMVEPIPKPKIDIGVKEVTSEKSPSKRKTGTEKMKTAASIRQRSETKEPVQKIYTWQENNESTVYFILGAIIFIITGISLVFLGLYIR